MKKVAFLAVAVILAAVGGMAFVWNQTGEGAAVGKEVSQRAAQGLQAKIDAVKKASTIQNRSLEQIEVSDSELESYVLFALKDDIPARMDSFDVQLTPDAVAADTRLTFSSNSTGNPMIDILIGGTHNLFVKGKMSAKEGKGQFDLEQVRIDGIPVPTILIQTLVDKYVKPKYPDVDLKAPFEMPWGIDSLTITQDKATIVY